MNLYYSGSQLTLHTRIDRLFAPTIAECSRRKIDGPLRVARFISPGDPAPIYYNRAKDSCVIRYGKINRLKEFISGTVTFTRADVFNGLSNDAQRDNEMVRDWYGKDQEVTIAAHKYFLKDVKIRYELKKLSGEPAHYHILCLSLEESAKLQRAFGDNCGYVRIEKFAEFRALISQAIVNKYGAAGRVSAAVDYYDDLLPIEPKNLRDLVFLKKIEYSYQNEVRVALLDLPTEEKFITVKVDWPKGMISNLLRFDHLTNQV